MATTIDRTARDALYEEVLTEFTGQRRCLGRDAGRRTTPPAARATGSGRTGTRMEMYASPDEAIEAMGLRE